jgi:hypothetical protein
MVLKRPPLSPQKPAEGKEKRLQKREERIKKENQTFPFDLFSKGRNEK